MIYTAEFLIERRKAKWFEDHDIERDKLFRESVAQELLTNEKLRNEIIKYPEKLIELIFIIVNKEKKTVPYFLNEVQLDFINNKLNKSKEEYLEGKITNLSFLILKGRQLGFTSLITAYQLACTIMSKNFEGYTIADSSDNAESIFNTKAKYMYNNLPDVLKPTEKYNTKRQLIFEKLNSTWSIDSATKDMGRSRTINFLHASECAFWTYGISVTQASLGEALTKDSIKIYESTANGFNDFKTMWDSGFHINCFYEWWLTKEYQLNFESDIVKEKFLKDIEIKQHEWIYSRLNWLKEAKHLLDTQLYWYFKKYQSYIDKNLIKQEYPCTVLEAFISSGNCVFNSEELIHRIEEIGSKRPLKIGYFIYDYDDTNPVGKKITNIRWVNDRNGYIKIYEVPNLNKYVIGGDTAGEGSDSFAGQVINAKTGQQVAVLKHKMDADLYTMQMYCLGIYYKKALIGIECNFDSFPIRELQRLGYQNMYVREKEDTYSSVTEKSFGFRTTSKTRPVILSNLIQFVRESINLINDVDTLQEMLRFIKNDIGRMEAEVGFHDDLVMAYAIALIICSQVVFDKETIIVNPQYQFSFEKKENNRDYGEEITPI